jgi:hypothetical protein
LTWSSWCSLPYTWQKYWKERQQAKLEGSLQSQYHILWTAFWYHHYWRTCAKVSPTSSSLLMQRSPQKQVLSMISQTNIHYYLCSLLAIRFWRKFFRSILAFNKFTHIHLLINRQSDICFPWDVAFFEQISTGGKSTGFYKQTCSHLGSSPMKHWSMLECECWGQI